MAGSWTDNTATEGSLNGTTVSLQCWEVEFTADASDGSVPDKEVGGTASAGLLNRLAVNFDDTTAPTAALVVKVFDSDGVAIGNEDGETLAASGGFDCNRYFVGPLTITVSGNSVNSAKAKVKLYVAA